METPTINKKQKKSTLSAKKKKPKETIKNVIAVPYDNSYWPLISLKDNQKLKVVLRNNLPKVKPIKVNVPWKILKNIPKSERKKFRNEYNKTDKFEINEMDREGLTFGINEVTKLLENNLVSAILASKDVQPKIMIKHLIDQAVLYKVPIIIVSNLRDLLFNVCGISSTVISISKNIKPQSKLNLIKECVGQIFKKYPAPLTHINYNRSLKNVSVVETSQHIEVGSTNLSQKSQQLNDDVESTIYLKRVSKDKRVFVPDDLEYVNIHKMEVDSTGFLPFSETSVHKTGNGSVTSNYKSLLVKVIKSDFERNKRKITSLKRKLT